MLLPPVGVAPAGPAPTLLLGSVAALASPIPERVPRGPRAPPLRVAHDVLRALAHALRARHPRARVLRVAIADLDPARPDPDARREFLEACDRALGERDARDGYRVAAWRDDHDLGDDDADDAAPHVVAVVSPPPSRESDPDAAPSRRPPPRASPPPLVPVLELHRRRGALVITVGEAAGETCGPFEHLRVAPKHLAADDAEVARRLARAVANVPDEKAAAEPRDDGGVANPRGASLARTGAVLCFADGTAEAIAGDALLFERTRGRGASARLRREEMRASAAAFGGASFAVCEKLDPGGKGSKGSSFPPGSSATYSGVLPSEYWPIWHGPWHCASLEIERAARLLSSPSTRRIVFFTGAGVSAESGVPTFREPAFAHRIADADGVPVDDDLERDLDLLPGEEALDHFPGEDHPLEVEEDLDPLEERAARSPRRAGPLWDTLDPEKVATAAAFRADPAACWAAHAALVDRVARTRPNAAHAAIAAFADLGAQRGWFETVVVTQNVDGLHARAARERERERAKEEEAEARRGVGGSRASGADASRSRNTTRSPSSTPILEIHGSLRRVTCLDNCGWTEETRAFLRRYRSQSTTTPGGKVNASELASSYPVCGGCGAAPAKPDATLFGEALPESALRAATAACAAADAIVVIGTSLSVYPAAALPELCRLHDDARGGGGGGVGGGAGVRAIVEINPAASRGRAAGVSRDEGDCTVVASAARATPRLTRRVAELREERERAGRGGKREARDWEAGANGAGGGGGGVRLRMF